MNPPQRCSARLRLALGRRRVIVERVRVIGVAMPPAVDGYRGDILIRVETAWSEDPRELVTRVRLEFLETERICKGATGAPSAALVLDGAVGPRYVDQVEDHRVLGARRAAIIADAHRVVELQVAVEPGRVIHVMNSAIDPRMPVADGDVDVDERRLDLVRHRLTLRGAQVRADVGEHRRV